MQDFISFAVQWICVPGVLMALFAFGLVIIARAATPERKASARAGLWGGMVMLVAYIIATVNSLESTFFAAEPLPSFEFVPASIGALIGFAFLLAARYLLSTRLVGVVVLCLSAASAIALYSYILLVSMRADILFLALGFAFGGLFHVVIFPNSIREILT